MVTIEEARRRTEEAKRQIAQQRQALISTRSQLLKAKPGLPTKQQLFQPGLQRLAERKISEVRRTAITQAEQRVGIAEREFEERVTGIVQPSIVEAERRIATAEFQQQFQRDVEAGRKLFKGGISPSLGFQRLPSDVRRFVEFESQAEAELQKSQLQFAQLKNLGLQPIFKQGELKGFNDTINQVSVSIEDLPSHAVQFPQLEKSLINIGVLVPLIGTSFKDTGSFVEAIRIGQELGQEALTLASKEGLAVEVGSVIKKGEGGEFFIPIAPRQETIIPNITFKDLFDFKGQNLTILEKADFLIGGGKFTTDEEGNKFFQASQKGSKRIPLTDLPPQLQDFIEAKGAEQLRLIEEGISKPILSKLPEGQFKQLLETRAPFSTTALLKFVLFAPAFETLAVKKATTKQALKKVVKSDRKKLNDFIKLFEDDFVKGNKGAIRENLRRLINILKNEKNPTLREQGARNLKRIIEELVRKRIISTTAPKVITKTSPITFDFSQALKELLNVPILKGVGGIGFGVKTITSLTPKEKAEVIKTATDKTSLNLKAQLTKVNIEIDKVGISEIQKISLKQKQKVLEKLLITSGLKFKLAQKSQQTLKQRFKQVQKVSLLSGLSQKQVQKQLQRTRQIQRQIQKQVQKPKPIIKIKLKPLPRLKIPIPFSGKSKMLGVKPTAPKPTPKFGFIPFAKQRGKFVRLSKIPLATLPQARSVARLVVDRTLSAQHKIKIVDNPKKVRKARIFRFKKDKFRDFKRRGKKRIPLSNFGEIERRKFRLDTPNETQTIQKFRKSKKFKSLFKVKRKKK